MSTSSLETRVSLLLRLQDSDDRAAWDEFVRLYGRVLFRVARGRGLQAADADNLVQEVLLAVARSIGSWLERPDRGRFRAWLLRIARNEAIDILTRSSKRPLGGGEAVVAALSAVSGTDEVSSQLDLEYERKVFQWAAEQVRSSVAEHTWLAFWLTHLEGLSIEEAAERLRTRPANIYFARSRVMARIKKLVQEHEEQS
ncbi:MAG: RNA polymerase sigma factor [Pirellulales bacterium]